MPSASLRRRISCPTTPSEIGSSPANGSSYITSIGSSAIARASATRRAMPPDSSEGISRAAPRRPTACSFISTRSRMSSSGQVRVLAQRERDVLVHRHVGEQRAELEQHPELAAHHVQRLAVEIGHRFAADQHAAGLRLQLPADEAQDRRLAAAGAAHDRHDAAARNRHRDAGEHRPPVVGERHVGELDGVLGSRGGRHGRRRGRVGHRIDARQEERHCSPARWRSQCAASGAARTRRARLIR